MSAKPTVLVLGATGFTGKLITKYLAGHRDSAAFTLALGARSKARLDELVTSLDLGTAVQLHVVDVTSPAELDEVVASVTVVINTVGPFWTWGTPVVDACAQHGIHYVDLTGETPWIKRVINMFHYSATKTGSIIVPSSGFDSVPADLVNFLASKTLREFSNEPVDIDTSVSAYVLKGGASGGTISTGLTLLTIPANERRIANFEYSLSPALGAPPLPRRLVRRLFLPDTRKTLTGAFYFMSPTNRALVQRTWGLFETESAKDRTLPRYGPAFKYDEFMVTRGPVSAVLLTLGMVIGFGAFMVSPLRWLLQKFLPKPGEGPSPSVQKNGFMKVTNITTTVASPARPTPLQVKTIMTGQGDPGYSLTSVLISEAALSLALTPRDKLPPLARRGGVLTPATALGDVYVERLVASGRVTFESKIVSVEGKKTV
ncbi:Saccharopine dehydrogenase-domain-containing protein [Mycena metata]|uniref:Saccharopine dehydrogenase-domain-containing protein n=1 Tax=Mycena metata TaxID=1033252 RepID=A0AAD7HIF2_9AGAR|nr:Saccharopine dehydrogenase-domain-containing protein [Mycena metata]